jgi:glycosyltransferase involved in cell wall biosynthesis
VRSHLERTRIEFQIAYIGSLAWQKGVHVLIEAFNHIPGPATLTIYGDPEVFPEYSAQLQALAQSPRIRFAGKLRRADLWTTLSEVDLIAVPSLWYENQPLTILEAFAANVPVIASNIGALPELVEDERTGWLVEPGDVDAWRQALIEITAGRWPALEPGSAKVNDLKADHLPRILDYYRLPF